MFIILWDLRIKKDANFRSPQQRISNVQLNKFSSIVEISTMDAKLCFFVAVTPLAENFELFNFTWITKVMEMQVVFFFFVVNIVGVWNCIDFRKRRQLPLLPLVKNNDNKKKNIKSNYLCRLSYGTSQVSFYFNLLPAT